jgi:hypothetical protein
MAIQSRYHCIWQQLKIKNAIRISVPAEAHKRLRQAIMKRKVNDRGFRFLMGEQNMRPHLSFKSEGNILSVQLHFSVRHLWL